MPVACPKCGSRFLRDSRPRDYKEKVNRLRFIEPLRCLDCQTRFVAKTLCLSDVRWARCPRCQRMDLSGWTGKTFEPKFFLAVKVSMGAKRWRCEYCRLNFASFRNRKEVFTFSRWRKFQEQANVERPGEDREKHHAASD